MSIPDALLCRTIKQGDDAIQWENETKAHSSENFSTITRSYGLPFESYLIMFVRSFIGDGCDSRWAQEFCGQGILKGDDAPNEQELKQMNAAMIEQQAEVADFVIRARSQAVDLSTYRLGVKKLKEMSENDRDDRRTPLLMRFRPLSTEKHHQPQSHQKHRSSSSSFASGQWSVMMKSIPTDNGHITEAMDIDGHSKQRFKIRFYPQTAGEIARRLGMDKNSVYYEAEHPQPESNLIFFPNDKIRESMDGENSAVMSLMGPLTSDDITGKEDVVYGKLVVHKAVGMPKKFRGLLPIDYRRRFFPFDLISPMHSTSIDIRIPDHRKQLYSIYSIMIQLDYIRLHAWPSRPLILVKSIMASASFRKKSKAMTKELKSKGIDGKLKLDHAKTERERMLKMEAEVMSIRSSLEFAASLLDGDEHTEVPKASEKEMPVFWCEDAKHWMTERVAEMHPGSLEEAVGKLQELLAEWCGLNARSIEALSIFLEYGTTTRPKEKSIIKQTKRGGKSTKERKDDGQSQGQSRHHEEELEQGEIPSVPKSKHSSKHRTPRRTPREERKTHRTSPQRPRASTDPRSRPAIRTGNMRADVENRERSRSGMARPRR